MAASQSAQIIKTLTSQRHREAALRFYSCDELRNLLVGSGLHISQSFSKEQLVQMVLQRGVVIQIGSVT